MFRNLLDKYLKFRKRVREWCHFNMAMGEADFELDQQVELPYRNQYISLDDRNKIIELSVKLIKKALARYNMEYEATIDPNECFTKCIPQRCIGIKFTIEYHGMIHESCVHFRSDTVDDF